MANILVYEYKDSHEIFKKKFSSYKVQSTSSFERIVKESQVVFTSTTYAEKPYISPKWLHDRLCAIPIHTRGWQNCDAFFDKIFVDDYEHTNDFVINPVSQLGDVLSKKHEGRENDKEKIICYNVGIAVDDIAMAKLIYEKAVEKKVGQSVSFSYEKEYIIE